MLNGGELSELEKFSTGPVAEVPIIPEGEWETFGDSVNGGYLDATEVRKARSEELVESC